MHKLSLALCLALSVACYRKPPVVNGRHREPVNDQERQERLSFCAELGQQPRQTPVPPREDTPATPVAPAVMPPASTTSAPSSTPATAADVAPVEVVVAPQGSAPSPLYRMAVHFGFNRADFNPTTEQVLALRPYLASAERIEVRARTDAEWSSPGDEKVALARALAAKRFLVAQGADPRRIVLNYLSGGGYVADNTTPAGRAENRRVEIEVFGGAR
jgi:outer membrane protein OmpA-like peptidoglycan-associated protein